MHHLSVTRWISEHRAPALVALAPVTLAALTMRHGIGISGDSVTYASTLHQLSETGRWQFNSLFPPGLPTIVALVGLRGALILNLAAMWAGLVATYFLALRVTPHSRTTAIVVMAWVGFSVGTIQMYSMLWTEPIFCLVITISLLILLSVCQDHTLSPARAISMIGLINVACLLRYAGLCLIAFTAVVLIWSVHGRVRERLGKSFAVAGFGSTGFLATITYNLRTGQPAMGPRMEPLRDGSARLGDLLGAIGDHALNGSYFAVGTLLGSLIFAWVFTQGIRWLKATGYGGAARHPAALLVAWITTYLAFILYSSMTTYINAFNIMGGRILAPILGPTAVVVATLLRGDPARPRLSITRPVALGYVLAVAVTTSTWVADKFENGQWYEALARQSPDLQARVHDFVPPDSIIVSNHPQLVAWVTGRDLVRGVPDAGPMPAGQPYTYDVDRDARAGDYMVWMDCCYQLADRPPANRLSLVGEGHGFAVYLVK